ncbi:MAG: hypothetical protein WC279_09710 [Sulfurimonas sp.]|jgi:predicted DNA binding CopG/RHH family protein|uniref:hypothetical protein n=1 Tax=Sulfurimonas sp. TaxID=2022749 RepID=UPI003566B282
MKFDIDDLLSIDKKTIEQGGHVKIKGGRPKTQYPKKSINAYFTEDQIVAIKNRAAALDLNVSTYIASLVLKDLSIYL